MISVTRHNTVPRGLRVCNIAPCLVITYVPGLALRKRGRGEEEEGFGWGVCCYCGVIWFCFLNCVRRVLLISIWPLPSTRYSFFINSLPAKLGNLSQVSIVSIRF